jgi:hypothetical protein
VTVRDDRSVSDRDLRSAIEGRIVDVLDGCPQLRPERSRHLLLDMVVRWSGMYLQVADYPTPRQWFFGLVGACANDSRSITMLLAAVVRFQPDPQAATTLMRLRDEWDAAETAADAPGELWSLLCAELSEIDRAEAVEPYRAATGNRLARPPAHCANAWQVFLHVVGLNAEVGGLPPYMIFLEYIAHRLTPATAGQVDQWNRRRAYEWGMAAELDRARLARPGRPAGGRFVHLIIQFEPDHAEPGRYLMSWWYQWDADEDSFELGGQRPVQATEMERSVGTVVLGLEAALADRDDHIVIEFILPHELLGLPVDWWQLETHAYLPTPLAKDYPVMLRSLERMRARHSHRVWRQRWGELGRRSGRGGIHWSRPDGDDHLDRLDTVLASDRTLVALVLSEPPTAVDGTGMRELEIAMRCGLPVVIWTRQESPPGVFAEALQAFIGTSGISDLPDRARRLRLDAMRLSPGERARHLGRHLALLWDDPGRQPERGYVVPLRMSGMSGMSGGGNSR